MEHTINETESKKRRKGGSGVWKYFTKIEPIDLENPRATCNYCGSSYACHSTKNRTTSLNRHINSCKKLLASLDETQKMLLFKRKETEGESSVNSLTAKAFSEQQCRNKVARIIVMDELPFSIVEGKGFVELLNELQPTFVVPCCKTIASDIFKLYIREKSKLEVFFTQLTSSICMTTDIWMSIQNINCMVVIAHFINRSWILQKKIINFCVIPDHKADAIAFILEKSLLDWKINKILTVTVDNTSSNEAALNILVQSMRNGNCLVLGEKFMHVRCFAHIVNLIVESGLKEHNDSIMRIRKAVKYVRSSPARLQKFKACIESTKITCKCTMCLDVQTRWNSTYLMLKSAEKFEKAFHKLSDCDINYMSEFLENGTLATPPSVEDWRIVREFIVLLKIFYDITLKVFLTLHLTANVFFSEVCKLHLVIKKYAASDNTLLRSMAMKMQTKLEKYWGDFTKVNHLMYADVVDLRYKLKFVKHYLLKLHSPEITNEIIVALEDTIVKLYAEYKVHSPRTTQVKESSTTAVDDFKLESSFKAEVNCEMDFGNNNEVDKYLSAQLESFDNESNLLAWWRTHSVKYPTWSQIAREVLAILISIVASESAFSCGGRVLDFFWSSLAPKTVESLICFQSWIRDSDRKTTIYEALEESTQFDNALDDIIADSMEI